MNTKLNFSKEDIIFNGTENEKKLKEELFDDSLLIAQKDEEIERLNNIINELEAYLKDCMESYGYEMDITDRIEKITIKNILRKIKELKGDGSNE